jgi:uncharacterized membrane protein
MLPDASKPATAPAAAPLRRVVAWPWAAILLGGIVLLGAALRLANLGAKSLWIDEAFSIWMARQPPDAIWRLTVHLDQHPPLYYLLLHGWMRLFGDSEAAARGLSALCGIATIPLLAALGARVAPGPAPGRLAALLLAVAPLHVRHAQEARMYTLLTLAAGLTLLCMLRLLDAPAARERWIFARTEWRGANPWWLGFIGGTALTLLSHNTAILFAVAVAGFIAGAFGPPALRHGLRADRRLLNWSAALGLALLLWLPWLPFELVQVRRVAAEFWVQPLTRQTVLEHWYSLVNAFGPSGAARYPLLALFGGLALLGAWRLRQRPATVALLLVLILVPFAGELLVSLHRPIFLTRTLLWTTLPLYLLLAGGLCGLRIRPLIGMAALAIVLLNLSALRSYYRNAQAEDWRGAAVRVAQAVRPGDVVLFNAGWMQIPFDYYYQRVGPPVAEHGLPADLFTRGILEPKMTTADLPRLRQLITGHSRVWLLYSHNWYTDPQGIILRDLRATLIEEPVPDVKGIAIYRFRVSPN